MKEPKKRLTYEEIYIEETQDIDLAVSLTKRILAQIKKDKEKLAIIIVGELKYPAKMVNV